MKTKKDYSMFYISMIIILCIMLFSITAYTVIGEIEYQEHLDSDLKFIKEVTEFMIYEAEIINYCANISNISNDHLIKKFTEHKAMEIINDAFLGIGEGGKEK